MHRLTVSAPGKIILFGDHSVVYGKKAIAASISLRTSLSFSDTGHDNLLLEFPNVELHLEINPTELSALQTADIHHDPLDRDIALDNALHRRILHYLESRAIDGVKRAAAAAFLYLYLSISTNETRSAVGQFRITSELPIGAGLGSSASVCVVISTSLLLLRGFIQHPQTASKLAKKEALELVNKWAYVGEQCLHGTPSGVDNTVATYGGAVAFQKQTTMQLLTIPSLRLLLTDTGVPRSTKDQVAKVSNLKSSLPRVIEPVLDAMHQVAIAALTHLCTLEPDLAGLGNLITINQDLLRTLGVSHASIERVVTETRTKAGLS